MKTIYKRHSEVDWGNVLGYLKNGEAIKIYFHNSLETLTVWGVGGVLLIQNSIVDDTAVIHHLANMGVSLSYGNLLEILIETSIFENDLMDISLIETVDFEISLITFD